MCDPGCQSVLHRTFAERRSAPSEFRQMQEFHEMKTPTHTGVKSILSSLLS